MWVFYLISLPVSLGMVIVTLQYFAGPDVRHYVLFTVGYAWLCSLSVIILVPADIWTTIVDHDKGGIAFFWSWSYWSTFILTWAVVPTLQGFEDAGDFTVKERLKTSIRVNLLFYTILGTVCLIGVVLLIIMHRVWSGGIMGLAMACSNTFGLVTGAFLLGFGLSEIPKGMWKNADWSHRQKVLSHRVAKMALKLDGAHQELSNAIVVAQATSRQMSKRDPLRPYMDVIDKMLDQMLRDDPSFKPSGGRLGDNDMDYDADNKSMASLRRQLRHAREEYYRCKSEYMMYVMEALELEDVVKNYEQRDSNGWKYVSSFRESRSGSLGSSIDSAEFLWLCIFRKQLKKALAVLLGCMSIAILLAEATMLPRGVDLSLLSIVVNGVGKEEILVQISAFVPLMYMCVCTYYSLFKIGMLTFYALTPRQTSSVSLLMICSMVARYAPPVSYNFLNLIRLSGNSKTLFESRMGNIDDAVPFFGKGFNKIYPLIMVIYTLLVASNFFGQVIKFFGSWRIFRLQNEEDSMDGFNPSGIIILQRERLWLHQGHKIGDQVVPLARNFNGATMDSDESASVAMMDKSGSETSGHHSLGGDLEAGKRFQGGEDGGRGGQNPESAGDRTRSREQQQSAQLPREMASLLHDSGSAAKGQTKQPSQEQQQQQQLGGFALRWASAKAGFQNFKANIGAKRFLPLRQVEQEPSGPLWTRPSSSETLDEIFQKLKRQPKDNEPVESDGEDNR